MGVTLDRRVPIKLPSRDGRRNAGLSCAQGMTRRRDHARRRKAVPWGGRRAAGAQTQARRKRSPARRFPLSFSRATETMSATFALSAAASARRAYPAPSTATRHRGNVRHVAARDSCVAGVGASGLAPGAGARARGVGRARRGVVYARVETKESSSSSSSSTRVSDMSQQMRDVRKQMEEDKDLNTLMAGLRGSNIDDSDFAADGVQMKVVDVDKFAAGGEDDRLPLYYDPELIAVYWRRRPAAVAQRIVQLLSIAGGFITGIVSDIVRGETEKNSVKRAIQLREIVTSLGPAYIKLGQALSIRPDLLSPDAMTELQKLCDKVPSFDNKTAFDCLEAELGCKWQEIYSELGPDPVAAASLGQVYKGKLRATGETVAVKVQRPAVLETVSIDLYIIRRLGLALRNVPQVNTDVVALLDEWAERFFEELDYVKEGENATQFAASIKDDLPQVVVPRTYAEYTRRKVITSEWLEGEKLSQSTADDVGDLVNIGVICYLKQLLDTGFFHADPHPGNLIRTPDGRLAILDFGLMTDIDDNIKFGMIEAIAHLIHRDYEAIVEDFVTLDFIPEGVDLKPILPPSPASSTRRSRAEARRTSTSRKWRQIWRRSPSTTPSESPLTSHSSSAPSASSRVSRLSATRTLPSWTRRTRTSPSASSPTTPRACARAFDTWCTARARCSTPIDSSTSWRLSKRSARLRERARATSLARKPPPAPRTPHPPKTVSRASSRPSRRSPGFPSRGSPLPRRRTFARQVPRLVPFDPQRATRTPRRARRCSSCSPPRVPSSANFCWTRL